jgi:hypothetical protein
MLMQHQSETNPSGLSGQARNFEEMANLEEAFRYQEMEL